MIVEDNALRSIDVETLGETLEIDLENMFRAIYANVMYILSSELDPDKAISEIDHILDPSGIGTLQLE